MGCDIHTVVQVKGVNRWVDVATSFLTARNYAAFDLLAGVRTNTKILRCVPISECKGLPDGFETDNDDIHNGYWMGDHSHSYLTLEEMQKYPHWELGKVALLVLDNPPCHNAVYTQLMPELVRIANEHKVQPNEIRIVFGFDS